MSYLNTPELPEVKRKVLNSALYLFVEQGFFKTSIPDLVKHSGVSTGSIYHSFKDKQDIAESLMQALLEQIEREQTQILEQHKTSWDRFYALSEWLMLTAQRHPHVTQFVLHARHKEFMPDLLPICSSKPFTTLRNTIQQGMDEGVIIQMDLMVAAACTYGGVLRLIQLSLDNMLERPLMSYLDEITQASWRSVAT
ncbi:TetR/AcrR family transcriptional regulator [Thiomicrorhabdus chilensis]|uniref:TetR/AcrR family transcriptional regulator n=1 Tax=Thiomicrorhabdus chilensis TaxID=63656 RepID=UPI00041EAE92|nr:TetR/AcrR family transcriptional regulator [Thiomicrorhabdus chilensis]